MRLERSRSFGAVWLGWLLWQALKLDELLSELLPRGARGCRWAEVIAILVIGAVVRALERVARGRAVVSDHGARRPARGASRAASTTSVCTGRWTGCCRTRRRSRRTWSSGSGELFELDYDLLLYDVTSTYFEGVADPAIAKRGYSRDHRPDCVQVNIALVVTREGMPLGYEIFSGNTTDVTTVEEIVETMEERFGKVNRVWVMDRGMVSAENIAWLNSTGRRYVIGTARAELKRWAKADCRQDRLAPDPRGCRGEDLPRARGQRDVPAVSLGQPHGEREGDARAVLQAHRRRACSRWPGASRRARRPLDRGVLERQIGRLLERNSRAAARYAIAISEDNSAACGAQA